MTGSWRRRLAQAMRLGEVSRVVEGAGIEFAHPTRAQREAFQLARFNTVWTDAVRNVPFYASWQSEHRLPATIGSLDELASWPIVSKRELQTHTELLRRPGRAPDRVGMTGGSTGEPLRFGQWREEVGQSNPAMWLGRAGYGVLPGDRTFLLWGHEHLYGKGLRRQLVAAQRRGKDWLLNSRRFSAYDLSPARMEQALEVMRQWRPRVVIAFSAAAIALARSQSGVAEKIQELGVRCVICSAGPLSEAERAEITSFFGAPLAMEYGAAECGVMAYTIPSGGYRTSWRSHILETVQMNEPAPRNIVTCLDSRYLPLIRYDVGDCLDLEGQSELRPHGFREVLGRPSDIVRFGDGTAFFGALIGDCVKQVAKVSASQTVVRGEGLEIHVLAIAPLSDSERGLIAERCRSVVPGLRARSLEVVEKPRLQQSPSGKIPLVVYES